MGRRVESIRSRPRNWIPIWGERMRAWRPSTRTSENARTPKKYYGLAMSHIDRMTDREKYRTRSGYYLLHAQSAEGHGGIDRAC